MTQNTMGVHANSWKQVTERPKKANKPSSLPKYIKRPPVIPTTYISKLIIARV